MAKKSATRKPQTDDDQMTFAGFDDPDPAKTDTARPDPSPKSTPDEKKQVKTTTASAATSAQASQPDAARRAPRANSTAKEELRQAVRVEPGSLPEILRHVIDPPQSEPLPDLNDKLVVVVDAHSLIYQVFHGLPPMTSSGGLPVNAVYGFVGDMLELIDRKSPDYLIAAFDKSEVTFRNELYDQYKANRDSMPDELRQQLPLIRQVVDAMGIGIMEKGGFEADDLLATVGHQVEQAGGRCLIVTSDKDCRQLITDKVRIYNIRKDAEMDADGLMDVWGIRPDQVVDFQSLVGDAVDNVPGVPLIGPKLAKQLLDQFDTLDEVLNNAESVSGKKRKQNLIEGRELALLSRKLVRLSKDVDTPIPWSRSLIGGADVQRTVALMEEFSFRRLKDRAAVVLGGELAEPEEAMWETQYQTIRTEQELTDLVGLLSQQTLIAIDTETTSTSPRSAELVGISVAWAPGQAAYIPVMSPDGDPNFEQSLVIDALRPIIESTEIRKVGQNLKYDAVVLRAAGATVRGIQTDTMLADYLLNPGSRNHTLDDLARRYLNHTTTSIKELIGTGKKQILMSEVPLSDVSDYACEDVDVPIRIATMVTDGIREAGLDQLYTDVEMPLIGVLTEMEFNGIRVDAAHLSAMSETFTTRIETLRQQITELAGRPFNIDSPKQLGEVMFNELDMPVVKKTKTGFSTDAEVLSTLAVDYELPSKVLEYRQATKLKNTYIDALPLLICPSTGRIHTSFRQDVAATGRLSSSDPNLQNIPIRTTEGRAIRGAFRAGNPDAGENDWLLLGADYSQIELRVLAHYSGDPALIRAYQDDADIHTRVAAEVNGIDESDVTSELRRIAKSINFGIVYGQSPFGLAKALRISQAEARDYIELYFQRYAGVEEFMMQTLRECRKAGSVSTMLGRHRDVQGVRDVDKLDAKKRRSLTEAERIAINTPIQGSAADLIKLAMLAVHRRLENSDLQARMLLQIHDELLFEVAPDDAPELEKLVREEMTGVVELKVPLKVDVAIGTTWADT